MTILCLRFISKETVITSVNNIFQKTLCEVFCCTINTGADVDSIRLYCIQHVWKDCACLATSSILKNEESTASLSGKEEKGKLLSLGKSRILNIQI